MIKEPEDDLEEDNEFKEEKEFKYDRYRHRIVIDFYFLYL